MKLKPRVVVGWVMEKFRWCSGGVVLLRVSKHARRHLSVARLIVKRTTTQGASKSPAAAIEHRGHDTACVNGVNPLDDETLGASSRAGFDD